jgi:hypothetical protein
MGGISDALVAWPRSLALAWSAGGSANALEANTRRVAFATDLPAESYREGSRAVAAWKRVVVVLKRCFAPV